MLAFLVFLACYALMLAVTWKALIEPLIWRLLRNAMARAYMTHGLSKTLAMRQATESMRNIWEVMW